MYIMWNFTLGLVYVYYFPIFKLRHLFNKDTYACLN